MNDIIKPEQKFEKFARFQALQAGHYWRATAAIHEQGIDEDEVLLIESIRWVDNAPHTIILRAHPSKYDKQLQREIPQEDGSTTTKWVRFGQHRFLLKDFVDAFEFEPDHQAIRTREVQAIHGRINLLQQELVEGQVNPEVLAQITHDGLRAQREAEMRKAGATAEEIAAAKDVEPQNHGQMLMLTSGTVASALGTGITVEGITALRESVGRESQIATIKAKWITEKTTQISETIQALTPFYQEQAAAALANTEDVRKQVEKLLLGIESLDLYVGKDVHVHTICTGASAHPTEPLTFVQRKLMMDEELAVWADLDEWFDFEKEDLFFKALVEHESLIDQIFPTERCVLVMAATRRSIDYGDNLVNRYRNEENRKVFLMVRDGMNVHRVFSPVESHLGTSRLFPSKDDQERVFAGIDGSQIKFEDVTYTDKLAAHERFALHYKRFLLLVCGLDHRLKLFGDFYEGPPTLKFVSMEFQEARCRFLHDDDGAGLLPGERRQSVESWISEKNEYLRSGSRVLCNWSELMNPDTAPSACKADSRRDYFNRPYTADSTMDVEIAYRKGDSICVDVLVNGYSYSTEGKREFKCKVNITELPKSSWRQVDLPYLCLDAVTPEDIHWYIHNRETRRNHISYIRFFKHALKHLIKERDAERNTRQRLAQALKDGAIAFGNEADGIIQQAVIAWRAANRGKDLPRFEDGQAPAAWKALLDQMYLLAGEGKRQAEAVGKFVTDLGMIPLRLVLSGSSKMMVYAAPVESERDDRITRHTWAHFITLAPSASGYVEKSRRWALVPVAAASETTLHEWPEVAEWAGKTAEFTSYEQKQETFNFPAQTLQKLCAFTKPMDSTEFNRALHRWTSAKDDAMEHLNNIRYPSIAFPIGVVRFPRTKEIRYLCVASWNPVALLYRLAPDDAARALLRKEYIRLYDKKISGETHFEREVAENYPWLLKEVSTNLSTADHSPYIHSEFGTGLMEAAGSKPGDPLLNTWLERYKASAVECGGQLWLIDGVTDDAGRPALDELLSIKLPSDYKPVVVRSITITEVTDTDTQTKVTHWFDIFPTDIKEPETKVEGNFRSWSSSSQTVMTLSEARAHVKKHEVEKAGRQYKLSKEIHGHPALPEGVIERWCAVSRPGGAAE